MMCVLPLLSGGISSWRQGRGNPLRHTTTHIDTGVSLDSPSSSTTTTSMPLGLLLSFYPNSHPPPSLPRPCRLSSALSLLFAFFSVLFCLFHPSAVCFSLPHVFLFLCIKLRRIAPCNALRSHLRRSKGSLSVRKKPHEQLSSDDMVNPMYDLKEKPMARYIFKV